MFRNVAGLCNQIENRQYLDILLFNLCGQALLQCSRNVFIESAAGDVCDGLYSYLFQQGQNRLYINLGRHQQSFTQCCAQFREMASQILAVDSKDLPNQRIAVGMNTARRECNQDIPFLLGVQIQNLLLIHQTNCKTSHVIFIDRIEARHFSGFAANQCTASLYAAFCHTGNNFCNLFRNILAQCNIVQEELRLCTTANNIIDAHCHAVNADGVVSVHQECDFQLCTNAVCTGNEYWMFHAGYVQFIQSAETADAGQHIVCHGACDMFLH